MRQSLRTILPTAILALSLTALLTGGCEKPQPSAKHETVPGGIVSLTPAGTDMLVAMGLAGKVVGVSPYEANDSMRKNLPKVGDYLRVDWEKLTDLKPAFLVVQGKKDRLPAGMREKCEELGIKPIILQIDALPDIEAAIRQLGTELGETPAAEKTVASMEQRIDALKKSPAKPVTALVAISDSGTAVVGTKTFIDDALKLAGGTNVIQSDGYVTLDAEKLSSLKPDVVFLLLPDAADDVQQRAKQALLANLPGKPPIRVITDRDAMIPGTSVLHLAETMAAGLRAAP